MTVDYKLLAAELLPLIEQGFSARQAESLATLKTELMDEMRLSQIQRRFVPGQGPDEPNIARGANGKTWKSFGQYLVAIRNASAGKGWDDRLVYEEDEPSKGISKDLAEGEGSTGGFLVPEEYRNQLLQIALEEAVIRPRATKIPMRTDKISIPRIVDNSHASTIFGGVVAYWEGEADTISNTDPKFGKVNLIARKLAGYSIVGNELLTDSAIALESLIMLLFGMALAYYEDDAFINGTGAGQPLGIYNSTALISVSKETGQQADTIITENVVKMLSRIFPASQRRALWLAHPDTRPQLYTMKLDVGTGGVPVYLPSGGLSQAPFDTLFGRPVIYTEKCQTVGDLGDIYLVDLFYYLIGDRSDLKIDSSIHVKFTTDQTVWRFVKRLDGQPWLDSAQTPKNGSTSLSAFVALAARA